MQEINPNGFNQIFYKYNNSKRNLTLIEKLIKEQNLLQQNYKTEFCKKFQSTGYCPYGAKCRFAHRREELVTRIEGPNYKKEKCKSFFEKGFCNYGSRCKFQHDERKFKDVNLSFFYFRLFLSKNFGFPPPYFTSFNNYSNLVNGRLKVFEALTNNYNYNYNCNYIQ